MKCNNCGYEFDYEDSEDTDDGRTICPSCECAEW